MIAFLCTAFWICVALVFYTYIAYPMLVMAASKLWPKPVRKREIYPRVSLIVSAYNEAKTIRAKLENALESTYPKDRLEIIVVADGSSDTSPAIVAEYADCGIKLLYEPERRGKVAAMNRAAPFSSGEILLFSDANTVYPPAALEKLVRNFHDPEVGGVSGRKILIEDVNRDATRGETAYWSYETNLKMAESLLGSIPTADGEIFALRRALFQTIPADIVHDDMYLTMSIVAAGYRVVFESEATSAEKASITLWDEFHLKVRYSSAGYQIFSRFRRMFFPPRSWFAVRCVSHKLLRWLVPLFLLGALLSSSLISTPFYRLAAVVQIVFYLLAVAGGALNRRVTNPVLYFALYFSLMNTAALYGFMRHFFHGDTSLWRKAER
jgi:cellulose synthase/poly-beta-1,6-N-acetylglucosamine synthase-like glycosyltransferase